MGLGGLNRLLVVGCCPTCENENVTLLIAACCAGKQSIESVATAFSGQR